MCCVPYEAKLGILGNVNVHFSKAQGKTVTSLSFYQKTIIVACFLLFKDYMQKNFGGFTFFKQALVKTENI